ncbi:MAG: hypothetical protein HYX69_13005 [Planctomycetia bacterium]|nr:hypothetical protein [Planctomycetia bacterium]
MTIANVDVVALAWAQLWQVTLVAAVLGLIARFGCRRRPHLAYLLWMLVVLKAVTPPVVASPTGIFSWAQRAEVAHAAEPQAESKAAAAPQPVPLPPDLFAPGPRVTAKPVERLAAAAAPAALAPADPPRQFSPVRTLFAAWAVGAMALAAYVLAKWLACRRRWHASAVAVPDFVERQTRELAVRLGVRRRVRVLACREAAVPAVFGVWRPTILLPAALVERLAPDARQDSSGAQEPSLAISAILAHELVHVRRGDPAASLVQLVAQLAWWFHPLIWWANREARRERERACDEEVVTGLACRATDYARVLLDVLAAQRGPQPAFAMPGVGMLGVTARRLEHLVRRADRFHRRTPLSYYAIAVVAVAVLLPGAGLQVAAAPSVEVAFATTGPPAALGRLTTPEAPTRDNAAPPADASPSASDRALDKLRELGARAERMPGSGYSVAFLASRDREGNERGWKGSAADFALLNDVDELRSLLIDLTRVDAADVAQLRLKNPVEFLSFLYASDKRVAKLAKLPDCRVLNLEQCDLSPASCKRMAELAAGIEKLQLKGPSVKPGEKAWVGVTDDGLKQFAALSKLKFLSLASLPITDDGISALAGLPQLETLLIQDCPDVRGPGFAALAPIKSLRQVSLLNVTLAPDGLKAIAQLSQLKAFTLYPADFAAEDAEAIASMSGLQSLSLSRNWSGRDIPKDTAPGDTLLHIAARLPQLQMLAINGIATSDDGLAAIPPERDLRGLTLYPTRVSDRTLQLAGRFPKLQHLALAGEGTITDDGLKSLAHLTRLKRLRLPGRGVTDAGLQHLAPLAALETLSLPSANVTGDGLAALAGAKKLKELTLTGATISDEGAKGLAKLQSVEQLYLDSARLSDQALAEIGRLANLRDLEMMQASVTDKGLASLGDLKNLRTLSVKGTPVTNDAAAKLEAAIPGLKIQHGKDLGFTARYSAVPVFADKDDAPSPTDGAAKEPPQKPAEKPDEEPQKEKAGAQEKIAKPKGTKLVASAVVRPDGPVATHPVTVRGRAIDENGKPVAGAKIELVAIGFPKSSTTSAVSAADGQYEFREVPLPLSSDNLGTFEVSGTAASHGRVWSGLRIFHDTTRADAQKQQRKLDRRSVYRDDAITIDLKFRPEALVRGHLVDEAGRPIAGAKIMVSQCMDLSVRDRWPDKENAFWGRRETPTEPQVTSDADGRFVLRNLARETAAFVTIQHPDFGMRGCVVGTTDRPNAKNPWTRKGKPLLTGEVNLTLARVRSVRVGVRYEGSDEPAVGLHVWVQNGEQPSLVASAMTDGAGMAMLSLPPGKYELHMRPDPAMGWVNMELGKAPLVVADTPQQQSATVRVPQPCKLVAEVVDADTDRGISGAGLSETPGDDADAEDSLSIIEPADASGKLTRLVKPGKRGYEVNPPPGYEVVEQPNGPIDLPAGKTVTVRYKLRKQAAKQKPAEANSPRDAEALFAPAEASPRTEPQQNDAGESETWSTFSVILDAPDAATAMHSVTIRGRAVDQNRKPVAGATLELATIPPGKSFSAAATTDAEGRYEFRDLALPLVGEGYRGFVLTGTAHGYARTWRAPHVFYQMTRAEAQKQSSSHDRYAVYRDDAIAIDLKFRPEVRVRGRLVDDAGLPIAGAQIAVTHCSDQRIGPGSPDAPEGEWSRPGHAWWAGGPPPQPDATSDADGRFELGGLAADTAASLSIQQEAIGMRYCYIGTGERRDRNPWSDKPLVTGEINLTLARARTVRAQVLFEGGDEDAAGFHLQTQNNEQPAVVAAATADEHGVATLQLPPGTYSLGVGPDQGFTFSIGYTVPAVPLAVADSPQDQSATIRVPKPCALLFEIVDADTGRGVAGAGIAMKSPNAGNGAGFHPVVFDSIDAGGRLRRLVAPGRQEYELNLPPGYAIVEQPAGPIDLPAGKTVTVRYKLRKQAAREKPAEAKPSTGESAAVFAPAGKAPDAQKQSRATHAEGKSRTADSPAHVRAVEELKKLGAEIKTDDWPDGRRTVGVSLQAAWMGGADGLKLLAGLDDLDSLDINSAFGLHPDTGAISGSADHKVTDAWLARLAGLKTLRAFRVINNCDISDEGLKILAGLANLEEVFVSGDAITDDGLAHLGRLSRLKKLGLDAAISDAGLAHLAGAAKLESLNVVSPKLTGAGLATLPAESLTELQLMGPFDDDGLKAAARFKNLKRLYINNTEVTDAGLAHIEGLDQLESVFLEDTKVTGAGLVHLAGLTKLTSLRLNTRDVHDDDLSHLAGLKKLAFLMLVNARITGRGLSHLAALPDLRALYLTGTGVSDKGIDLLARLKQLQRLDLSRTEVTKEGVARLSEALPAARIGWSEEKPDK